MQNLWRNSDGSLASYFNWLQNNIGNEPSGDGSCVEVYLDSDVIPFWNDQVCYQKRPFVCQHNQPEIINLDKVNNTKINTYNDHVTNSTNYTNTTFYVNDANYTNNTFYNNDTTINNTFNEVVTNTTIYANYTNNTLYADNASYTYNNHALNKKLGIINVNEQYIFALLLTIVAMLALITLLLVMILIVLCMRKSNLD